MTAPDSAFVQVQISKMEHDAAPDQGAHREAAPLQDRRDLEGRGSEKQFSMTHVQTITHDAQGAAEPRGGNTGTKTEISRFRGTEIASETNTCWAPSS